jgi:hypothetical protein
MDFDWLTELARKWLAAVTNPEQFLAPNFQPTDDQLAAGVDFYLKMLIAAFALSAPLILLQRGGLDIKARATANALLGLLFGGAIACSWYLSFSWLGGTASLKATYLAYVYSGGPYLLVMPLITLLMLSGLPRCLQRAALNPATARTALQDAQTHPDTDMAPIGVAVLLFWAVSIWASIVQFRALSEIHQIHGWLLVGAIALSLVIVAPVSWVWRKIGELFSATDENPTATQETTASPQAHSVRLHAIILGLSVALVIAGICTLLVAAGRPEPLVVDIRFLNGPVTLTYLHFHLIGSGVTALGGGLATYVVANARLLRQK